MVQKAPKAPRRAKVLQKKFNIYNEIKFFKKMYFHYY